MMSESPDATAYLLELYRLTEGNPAAQVSMFDVGAAMGIEKSVAGKLAEEMIGQGWAEVRTLSGGIGITEQGIEAALSAGAQGASAEEDLRLGNGPILDEGGRQALEKMTAAIKSNLDDAQLDYTRMEELILDVKTMEVQLLSPRPKTAVLREILRSLQENLAQAKAGDLAERLERMIR